MKTTNLTRLEARQAMLLGKKVRNKAFSRDEFYFFDGKEFKLNSRGQVTSFSAGMEKEDGYFIYEPEPTFKEVTMYAPVVKHKILVGYLYKDKDEAMKEMNAIGYTEVKVFLKSEGDNG